MFAAVEARIRDAETRPSFWLRTRSTFARRGAAALAALVVVIVVGVILTRRDFACVDPLHLRIAVAALAALLGLSLHHALRPLHRPPLSGAARAATVVLSLAATFVLARVPPEQARFAPGDEALLSHVSRCLFYGLFMGVPIDLVLRLLDRGSSTSALLAACAAGAAGNLVLTLHCPSADTTHLMLGHFLVAVLFVASLGLVHAFVRARER